MPQNQCLGTGTLKSLLAFVMLGFCSLAFIQHVSAAEVYKWVDENGVVTYSQQKPVHTDSRTVKTAGTPPSAVQAHQQSPKAELNAEQQQDLADLELAETDRIAEEKTRRASNCTLFTKLLAQLTAKDRVRAREPDGSERMVPEEERQERITAAKQEIELNCN